LFFVFVARNHLTIILLRGRKIPKKEYLAAFRTKICQGIAPIKNLKKL
jgi:hypothetical protein